MYLTPFNCSASFAIGCHWYFGMAAGSENPQPTKNVLILSCLKVWGHNGDLQKGCWARGIDSDTLRSSSIPNPRDLVRSVVPFPDTSLGPGRENGGEKHRWVPVLLCIARSDAWDFFIPIS